MKQKGVTFVEIMAVMVILSLLTLALYRSMSNPISQSRQTNVESDLRVLKKMTDSYVVDNGGFPDVTQMLNDPTNTSLRQTFADKMSSYSDFKLQPHVSSNPDNGFITLETTTQKDPWGDPYYILFPKDNTQPIYILSQGPDKVRGTYSSGNFGDDLVLIIQKK